MIFFSQPFQSALHKPGVCLPVQLALPDVVSKSIHAGNECAKLATACPVSNEAQAAIVLALLQAQLVGIQGVGFVHASGEVSQILF